MKGFPSIELWGRVIDLTTLKENHTKDDGMISYVELADYIREEYGIAISYATNCFNKMYDYIVCKDGKSPEDDNGIYWKKGKADSLDALFEEALTLAADMIEIDHKCQKVYNFVWESKDDGESSVTVKTFDSIDKARKELEKSYTKLINEVWDFNDAKKYDMNDDYDEDTIVYDKSVDFFHIYVQGQELLNSDYIDIRETYVR